MADLPASDKPIDPPADQPKPENPAPSPDTKDAPSNTTPEEKTTDKAPEENGVSKPADASSPTPPAKPTSKRILFIVGALLVVGLAALFAYVLSTGTQNKTSVTNSTTSTDTIQPTLIPQKDTTATDINNPQAFSKMLVYGSWSGQTSLIKAVELSTNTTTLLASLPSSIKKVSVLSAQNFLYIDQTSKQDHGKQLVIYNIKTKSPQGSIPASPGFGIDEYVLSPDKKYVAIWEVAFAPNSQVLQGGKSRVYAVDLSRPTVKKLLYDETAGPSTPVHYPRAILNNGRVFADKFLPNDPSGGAGWAYGLSVVDFDGTNRQDLPSMQSGTYGTQPSLSPDGKYLLFSGYDGSRGKGTATDSGYRQAILTPNTVELLDTETLSRQKLPNLDNKNIYSSSEWDASSGKIIITIISANSGTSGVYSYNLNDKQPVKINIPSTETTTYGFLTQITDNTTIIGTQDTNASNLGNLGDGYAFPFTQMALWDNNSSKVSFVRLEDTFTQYITILPGDYFKAVLGIQAQAQEIIIPKPTFIDLYSNQNENKPRQQLYTFLVKSDLLAIRLKQQSTPLNALNIAVSAMPSQALNVPNPDPEEEVEPPTCEEIAIQQCAAQGLSEAKNADEYETCVDTNKDANKLQKSSGLCSDSPLYLYGPEGQTVSVKINTPVSNAIPSYNNGYNVTLAEDGKMRINGNTYASIAYDYKSNLRKMPQPKNGTIVKRNEVEKVLREYAKKLGLNEKEAADLISAGKQKATGQYVFISFFDQDTSEQILPITFIPEPDNYLNVVFYFKNINKAPNYTPIPPVFPEPISRTGFTAVEISEIVE
jgi:hypothetical protein